MTEDLEILCHTIYWKGFRPLCAKGYSNMFAICSLIQQHESYNSMGELLIDPTKQRLKDPRLSLWHFGKYTYSLSCQQLAEKIDTTLVSVQYIWG